MTARTIDEIDRQILSLLQENGRMAQSDIAKTVRLAPSAVMERIRKLEARGIITGYAALIDPHALDHGMLAFVAVRTNALGDAERQVASRLAAIPEVLEVHYVAGDDCLLLKMRARDAEHIGVLLRSHVAAVPGVRSTRTTIVLGSMKESPRLPIALEEEAAAPEGRAS